MPEPLTLATIDVYGNGSLSFFDHPNSQVQARWRPLLQVLRGVF